MFGIGSWASNVPAFLPAELVRGAATPVGRRRRPNARLIEAQALVAQTDSWFAEVQRSTTPAHAARPSGCKPLCDLVVGAPLGHTPISPQPGERFRIYYNAGSRPVAVRTVANVPGYPATEVQYLHPDHLGSVGQITSQTGAWVQDVYFYPYGGIRWSQSGGNAISPTSGTRRTYTGQRDIGFWAGSLMHYNARQYSPYLNCFTCLPW